MQATALNDNWQEQNELDGIVRCPLIARYAPGGIFYFEVVICADALKKLQLRAVAQMANEFPIEITHNLDDSMTLRGFRRLVYSSERALFEAAGIVKEFREATRLELGIVEARRLMRQ